VSVTHLSDSRFGVLSSLASDVFITAELASRSPRKADYLREKLALQDLATRMADNPKDVLSRFVELAMQMTGGSAGGLSLFEQQPAPGVFRWQHLCGSLSRFEGATTPRNDSPCGVTLDQKTPVLTRHSERLYKWIADANIEVPEVLLVPLFVGEPEPLGTLWIVADTEGHFDSGHARNMTELAAFVGIALRMQRNEERLRATLKAQEVLTREMNHRLKNVFALVDGMIQLSARGTASKEDLSKSVSERLRALASAHALVLGDAPGQSDLLTLIRTILRPYEIEAGDRFLVTGPLFVCSERAVTSLALVIHELATNAAKYGALRSERGAVQITWAEHGAALVLRWVESGGPPVAAPICSGFGSKLIQSTITVQFGGKVHYDWQPNGLIIEMKLPIEAIKLR
jgi:two-component sensor histidine kinase